MTVEVLETSREVVEVSEPGLRGPAGPGLANHSTAEHETGEKWVDGKNIYRKCFDIDIPPSTGFTYSTPHGITGVEAWIRASFTIALGSQRDPVIQASNSEPDFLSFYVIQGKLQDGNIVIEASNDNLDESNVCVILEYTKT